MLGGKHYLRGGGRTLHVTLRKHPEGEYGFCLGRSMANGFPYVDYIVTGSPADTAGIRPDDIIVEVNGQELVKEDLAVVTRMIAGHRNRVEFLVVRPPAFDFCKPPVNPDVGPQQTLLKTALPLPRACKRHDRELASHFSFISCVMIQKGPHETYGIGLGYGVCPDRRHYAHVITDLKDKNGLLGVGDVIVAVNGENVEQMQLSDVLRKIQQFPDQLRLHVIKPGAYNHYAQTCHPCNVCRGQPGREGQGQLLSLSDLSSEDSAAEREMLWAYEGAPDEITDTCAICAEEKLVTHFRLIKECNHKFCRRCLASWVLSADRPAATCPMGTCQGEITHYELSEILTSGAFDRFLARSLAMAIRQIPNIQQCRRPDCPGAWVQEGSDPTVNCPVCQALNCRDCEATHTGMSCSEWREMAVRSDQKTMDHIQQMLTSRKYRKCPSCRYIVYKLDGCDTMICGNCRRAFSWSGAL